MKRFIAIMVALIVLATLSLTAHAVTPKLNINLPEIPDITNSVRENIRNETSDTMWENWFKEHPIRLDWSKIHFDWSKLNLFRW